MSGTKLECFSMLVAFSLCFDGTHIGRLKQFGMNKDVNVCFHAAMYQTTSLCRSALTQTRHGPGILCTKLCVLFSLSVCSCFSGSSSIICISVRRNLQLR